MITVGNCPCCETGNVGYRQCGNRDRTVVLMCDECALVWMHPNEVTAAKAEDPLEAAFTRRHPGCKLRPSRWAEAEAIQDFGWGTYILTPEQILNAPANPEDSSST